LTELLTELEKDEYRDVRWVVEEVLSIINNLDLPAIREDLSFRQRKAISRKVRAADEDLIVREHFLRNIFGFEYLIAPYTIAHLKLSQYLKDRGRPLKENERLQVLLTNTLEPIEPLKNLLMPAVTEEVKAAQHVKEKPIRVITGNPPYSGESKNKGGWITRAIETPVWNGYRWAQSRAQR
jgi:hypothetical protein